MSCSDVLKPPLDGDFATTRGSNCYYLVVAQFLSRSRKQKKEYILQRRMKYICYGR